MGFSKDFMWSALVHLGTNLWAEQDATLCVGDELWELPASNEMRLDKAVWDRHILDLKEAGANTLIIDLADGVVYDSHPEIAVKGAWTKQQLSEEITRLRLMGFELIPKLNFSTTHDIWLKEYSHMVSTPTYYKVCEDLIDEVCELFKPKYLHLGMDEEVYENQEKYNFVVIRQQELWWKDLYRLVERVEKNNARAMMWSDYARHRPDEFVQKIPKSVVQCVWYYFTQFGENGEALEESNEIRIRPFELFDKHGIDQVPGGSSCYYKENFEALTKYCSEHISKERLLGFLQTSWEMNTEPYYEKLKNCSDAFAIAKKQFN